MIQQKPFASKKTRRIEWVEKDPDSGEVVNQYRMTPEDREILEASLGPQMR